MPNEITPQPKRMPQLPPDEVARIERHLNNVIFGPEGPPIAKPPDRVEPKWIDVRARKRPRQWPWYALQIGIVSGLMIWGATVGLGGWFFAMFCIAVALMGTAAVVQVLDGISWLNSLLSKRSAPPEPAQSENLPDVRR